MRYTVAILEVSKQAFEEIKQKLLDAGYDYAISNNEIDMHGISLKAEQKQSTHSIVEEVEYEDWFKHP